MNKTNVDILGSTLFVLQNSWHFWMMVGSILFLLTFSKSGDYFENFLGIFWEFFGNSLGILWEFFIIESGNVKCVGGYWNVGVWVSRWRKWLNWLNGIFLELFGNPLGILWEFFGNSLRVLWEFIGNSENSLGIDLCVKILVFVSMEGGQISILRSETFPQNINGNSIFCSPRTVPIYFSR